MRYDENFREIIIKELKKGSTNSLIYPIAIAHGYIGTYKSFRDYTLQLKKKLNICTENENSNNLYDKGNDDLFIDILKSRSSIKILELCDIFKCPPSYIQMMINTYRNKGYEVTTDGYRVYLSKNFVKEPETIKQIGTTEVSFGVASDLHFGSKACQITALKSFCDICKKRDVHHILVPGDITAGHNVYPGQVYEEYAITADEQMNSVLANLPDGFEWYFMGGNHDHSFISKAGGFNIVSDLSIRRSDINYVGFDVSDIPILDGVDARLFHPSGGIPYSYCLSDDTEILTKSGWVGYKEISLSHEVATLNQNSGELEYQHPEELFIEKYSGKMIHFNSKKIDHLVTPQHNLWVRTNNGDGKFSGWYKVTAQEILDNYRREKYQVRTNIDIWNGKEVDYVEIPYKKWSGAKNLGRVKADDLFEFVGWYCSEGHLNNNKSIGLTQNAGENCEMMKNVAERLGLVVKEYKEKKRDKIRRIRMYNANLCRWLEKNCGKYSKDKKVPDVIKSASVRQIKIFLDSLFRGDGTRKNGHIFGYHQYSSLSEQLRNDVQELLLKIGLSSSNINSDSTKTSNVGIYNGYNTPYILDDPKEVEYNGIIWCVRVPNGLIYARRNGRSLWTGNSYKLQKSSEQLAYEELVKITYGSKEKPSVRFLLAGHLHIQVQSMLGPIFASQCGCFEGRTNYIKKKGLTPSIGGYIIKASLGSSGMIHNFEAKFYLFDEIEDDWKNYSHSYGIEKTLTPIFIN